MVGNVCNNCGSTSWAAANSNYCTDCERSWWKVFVQVVAFEDNPQQVIVDKILEEYGI
jgi:hypothetical protein